MNKVRLIARLVPAEGKRDELRSALRAMLAPTQVESGCELYELNEAANNGPFYFYEQWESQGALDDHMQTAHFQQLKQQLDGLLREPLELSLITKVE
jgi:quinol monooxygenase YgiN